MKRIFLLFILLTIPQPALAGFNAWTLEKEEDPFTKGERITASYSSSLRSGVFIFCDTSDVGITFRVVAGWEATLDIVGYKTSAALAVDKEVVLGNLEAVGGAYGSNIAGVDIKLNEEKSFLMLNSFVSARKQIAIKDGISDRSHILTERGSTKAANALLGCIKAQEE